MSILVTRPSPAGEELVSRLRTLGQVAWSFPLIEFSPGRELATVASRLSALTENDLSSPSRSTPLPLQMPNFASKRKLAIPSAIFCHWSNNGAGAAYC